MNKSELATVIANNTRLPYTQVLRVLDQFEQVTIQVVQEGGDVLLTGFAKFTSIQQPAKTRRNPQTGEPVEVPPKRQVKIRPGATFKRDVNA